VRRGRRLSVIIGYHRRLSVARVSHGSLVGADPSVCLCYGRLQSLDFCSFVVAGPEGVTAMAKMAQVGRGGG
jgi:hypothetical protein